MGVRDLNSGLITVTATMISRMSLQPAVAMASYQGDANACCAQLRGEQGHPPSVDVHKKNMKCKASEVVVK